MQARTDLYIQDAPPIEEPTVATRLATTLLLLTACGSACGSAGEAMYYFVDEKGVPHYSNVPSDPRYRPLQQVREVGDATPSVPALSGPASVITVPLPPRPPIPPPEPLPPEDDDDR
jgi:hypothetical protein